MSCPSSWQQQAITYWPLINRLAGRRFPQETMAEEAALFVMDKLAENDWMRMQAFDGQASLATYLATVTLRLLEDFSRSRFGRVKAPLWVRRLGGIWEALFRLLCLERFTPAEAVEILSTRQSCAQTVAEHAAYKLLGQIPNCGAHQGQESELPEDYPVASDDDQAGPVEHGLEQEERSQCLQALASIVFEDEHPAGKSRMLNKLLEAKIILDPRERLLLKLCFRDGLSVTEAGRMLGWNRHQVHGRLRRLLQRLRQDLADVGLDQELQILLAP